MTGRPLGTPLAETQRALAASQADLTRVERERDEAIAAQARLSDRLTEGAIRLTASRCDRDHLRKDLAAAEKERDRLALENEGLAATLDLRTDQLWRAQKEGDLLAAELATATAELERLRAAHTWVVARDGGRNCSDCDQEIRRGEAYEPVPTGQDPDELRHIHCRDKERTDG